MSEIIVIFLFLPPQSGEGFFHCKILRGKQVQILYSTRCCKFHQVEPQNVTVERREDAVPETSQKTCRCALLSLREIGGCKSVFSKHFVPNIDRSIL